MAGDIGDHFRDVRDTRRKRKRISDQQSPSGTAAASRGRHHQRKTSLNNRSFSINTRRSLDHNQPARPKADPRPRCYDWLPQKQGVHFARNRSSFSDYTSVNVKLDNGMWVQGIGSTHLDIMKGPDDSHGVDSIVLQDVLHLPNAICNGISMAMFDKGTVSYSPIFGCRDQKGVMVWRLDEYCGLHKLALLGDPQGESPLQDTARRRTVDIRQSLSLVLSDADVERIREAIMSNSA